MTGNVVENASVKLGAFGLLEYVDLDVGGFGSDHPIRTALVALAIRRARSKYCGPGEIPSVVVVGDTPRDVQAGHSGGALVLGVASGVHDVDRLAEAGADRVVLDLADIEAVSDFLVGDTCRD